MAVDVFWGFAKELGLITCSGIDMTSDDEHEALHRRGVGLNCTYTGRVGLHQQATSVRLSAESYASSSISMWCSPCLIISSWVAY